MNSSIMQEISQLNPSAKNDIFTVMEARECIKRAAKRPTPKRMLGELMYEGEVCIQFAGTNLGKSIFAVQAANAISSGTRVDGLINESSPKVVLYIDFELSDKQFQLRLTDESTGQMVELSENFLRAEVNRDSIPPDGFENHLEDAIESIIEDKGVEVLIIDNLTWITGGDVTDAKAAGPLMKMLCGIKAKHNCSLMVLAHTPKRDESKPIHVNDCAGSKQLANFCDSMFAIGSSSQDPQMRYIKQLKQRNCAQKFGADNVISYSLEKNGPLLSFKYIGCSPESDHLKEVTEDDKTVRTETAAKMRAEGKTFEQVGQHFGVSKQAVMKWLR